MKKKRIFFLVLNYIQLILCVLLISWLFGFKRVNLLERDYIGLFVFLLLIIFIANSLRNIFSANALANQMPQNKVLSVAGFMLTLFYILSVGLMIIVSGAGFYALFIEGAGSPRSYLGIVVAVVLSIISMMVLVNQYYFGKQLKKEQNEKLQSEIDNIGSEPLTHG